MFIISYILIALILSFLGNDILTSLSGAATSIANVGPGLGNVGAMGNYSSIPTMGKGILIFFMLLGRLEIYGVILLFLPMAWRK